MSLPASNVKARTRTVDLSGGAVEVHGLTLIQTRACRDANADEADVLCIAWGTDQPPAEVRAWLTEADPEDARKLLAAVMELSGLIEGAQFPVRPGDDDGLPRPSE